MDNLTTSLLTGFAGGAAALLLLGVVRRLYSARSARTIARDLLEELEAAKFDRTANEVSFSGFRSGVFDSRYAAILHRLPGSLVHDLAQYYSDCKRAWRAVAVEGKRWEPLQGIVADAPQRRDQLHHRLGRYATRPTLGLAVDPREEPSKRARAIARAGKRVWIRLSEEQRKGLKEAVGLDAEALQVSTDDLEQQLAPKLPRAKHLHGLWVVLGLDD